jgi:hypothetical protein
MDDIRLELRDGPCETPDRARGKSAVLAEQEGLTRGGQTPRKGTAPFQTGDMTFETARLQFAGEIDHAIFHSAWIK